MSEKPTVVIPYEKPHIEELDRLCAENQRLRTALERIKGIDGKMGRCGSIANEALQK